MKRNKHNLSNTKLLSADMGKLLPIGLVEVLPGDSFQHATSCLLRVQPLLAPVMHPVDVRIHHWFVPIRIIWDEFEDFITAGPAGTSNPVHPTVPGVIAQGSLLDYLGAPVWAGAQTVNVLPVRAYQMIWNEWYRDQDLQAEAAVSKASGSDTTTMTAIQNINWEKDYFTSSRPWEQKGPQVTIPLGTSAPVNRVSNAATPWEIFIAGGNIQPGITVDLRTTALDEIANGTATQVYTLDPKGGLVADLTGASAVTVSALRQALALQRFEEARARYGSRYSEYLRYLGVTSSDARLQRPEYLGGGRQTIQFSEVLQTAVPPSGSTVVGQMRGHGIAAMRSNRYRRFFEEHGFVLSLLSVRPKTMYMQGQNKTWLRDAREKYWQKEFEHIGQAQVLNREVYIPHATPNGVFGYQDRYDEYRRMENTVAGEFRSSALNFWHMAREFTTDPALNASFVSCVPTERVFPVPASDSMYIMARHQLVARRLVAQRGSSFTF